MTNTEIRELMTAMPHSIGYDQKLALAQEMMKKYSIRHLPVQKGGNLVGILSERDINLALALDQDYADRLIVEDVSTSEPYIVSPDTKLSEVASKMSVEKIGCTLVVENKKLVGIYTTVDACRDLARLVG